MATVEFRYDPKNTAWFTANAAMVLKAGEPAYHDTTGLFKLGDGVTALSALSFLPIVSSSSATIQQVLTTGNVATTTIETTGFIKTGGLSTEFLKADGTVDSSTYITSSALSPYLTSATAALTYQPIGSYLTTISGLNISLLNNDSGYITSVGTAATSLTTNNSSGAATLIANVLNVPNYTLAGLGGTTLAAVNAQNLSVFAATTSSQLAGVISDETGSGSLVFGTSPSFTTNITTPQITGVSGVNGIITVTNNTASGAIARGLYHTPTLVASANGNELYGETINPTFTNGAFTTVKNFGLGIFCGTGSIKMGNSVGSTSVSAIYINKATPSNSNFAIQSAGTTLNINGGPAVDIMSDTQSMLTFNPNGGTIIPFLFKNVFLNSGSFTASTEVPIVKFNGGTYKWGTGSLGTQRFFYVPSNTITSTAASTFTNVYNLFVEAPIAGTNATITNNYALGLAGSLKINDTFNIVFDTTTGSKLGTSNTQKISFWNAVPIVQPTTAVAAATVVSGTGGNVKHDDTFDGYTVEQVVRALRTIGLLA